MNRKAILILSVLLGAASLPVSARELTPAEALRRVSLDTAVGTRTSAGTTAVAVAPVYTARANATAPASLYAFNLDEGGYILVSADDRLTPLLGQADRGTFDLDRMPANARWWLAQYEEEIAQFLASDGALEPRTVAAALQRADVPYLVKTLWDQDGAFQQHLPNTSYLTGCVATSMAQIINYHKYAAGKGTYSYTYNSKSFSYTYTGATFDFANMKNSYGSGATQESIDAVAELMLACGISVHMRYGTSDSNASASSICYALEEYFGYDGDARYLFRQNYSTDAWEELLYGELAAGRPLFYGGASSEFGHSFICDGYRASDNTFHFNFGWSGESDGYYVTSALAYSLNKDQSAIAGVQPDKGNPRFVPLVAQTGLTLGSESSWYAGNYTVSLLYWMPHSVDTYITLGCRVVGDGYEAYFTDRSLTWPAVDPTSDYFDSMASINFKFYNQSIPAGYYRVYPAYKTRTHDWMTIPIPYGARDCLYLTVDASGKKSLSQEPSNATSITAVEASAARIGDLYDLGGTLILRNAERSRLPQLAPGLYLLRCADRVEKIVVR
jgi:hypothetical protein